MADVEVLLEVMPEREVEERSSAGGQFHPGGEPALDNGKVARCEMTVELVHVGADLEAFVRRKARRIDSRAGHDDHAQRRHALLGVGEGGYHPP